jgi:hypothetical protein
MLRIALVSGDGPIIVQSDGVYRADWTPTTADEVRATGAETAGLDIWSDGWIGCR